MDGRGGRAGAYLVVVEGDEGNFVSLALIPDLVQLLDVLILLSSSPQHSLLSAPMTDD